jgi:PAS domain S-box-containing protein
MLASVRDITDRKERNRALEVEHERFLTLFENLPTPVVYGHVGEKLVEIKAVNPAFESVFGLHPGEAQGESLYDHVIPPGEQPPWEIVEQALAEERFTTEVRRQTVDGVRDFRLDVAMRERTDGPDEGYAVYTDVTQQKERERALERKNEQLDEFASVVGHDLTAPLATASGQIELAAAECDSDHLDRAQVTLERMESIVDDTLSLAREGRAVGDTEVVDLERLAERCWGTVSAVDADLAVEDLPRVEADPDRLRHLFENLFANAVTHADPDVTITVGSLPDGFYVADDGPGIPPDAREEVFEPGISGDSNGTGFGLAIVRRIAEAHGWEIEVVESESGGARFEIRGVERPSHAP